MRQFLPRLLGDRPARPFERLGDALGLGDDHDQIDELAGLVPAWGGALLDGPAEYPFAEGGYYALYFTGPDGLKFERVHMPAAEKRWREAAAT